MKTGKCYFVQVSPKDANILAGELKKEMRNMIVSRNIKSHEGFRRWFLELFYHSYILEVEDDVPVRVAYNKVQADMEKQGIKKETNAVRTFLFVDL